MSSQDVVIKHTQALRVAEMVATAPGPGPDNVGPIFGRLVPQVLTALERAGVRPGMSVGHYEEVNEDGSFGVHVGFEIGDQRSVTDEDLIVVDLPIVTVASLLHHGPLDTLLKSYEQLAHWISDSGHSSAGPHRELYLQWDDNNPAGNVTELQVALVE